MNNQATNKNGLETFDHVVVLMLENRSFDNLLAYLYEDGVPPGKSFAGLQTCPIEMPVPKTAKGYDEHPTLAPRAAKDYHQPFPDPGEVYQHVNTQLYNEISAGNFSVPAEKMIAPYNLPDPAPMPPSMTGFVTDYINTLNALSSTKGRKYNNSDSELYSVIMQCFKPEKIPVLSTLAREFAVFDHWFCAVPSQTWCNRAFWHAATSGGKVANPASIETMVSWIADVWTKETIFQRMHENNVSHAIYTENPISLTSLVNGIELEDVTRASNKLDKFKSDIANEQLPQYSFIEPKFLGQHNDQHPSSVDAGIIDIDGRTRVGTVLLGEKLIWDVYTTIKNSDLYRDNTLLIITYDEHGGCFDHVPPPALADQPEGQKNFKFNRLGIRVPMVMVSAYLPKNTIINENYEHTSFIKTMCEKWNMEGLTDRDKNAPSFANIFSDQKRTDFPDICEPSIPAGNDSDYANDPLNELQNTILLGASYLAHKDQDQVLMQENMDNITTVGEAIQYLESIKDNI